MVAAYGTGAYTYREIAEHSGVHLAIVGCTVEGRCTDARTDPASHHKIFLVVDNLRVHHAKGVSAWLAEHKDKIELAFLPPYAPESNPDEYLNRDLKTALRTGPVSSDKDSLLEKAIAFMNQLATLPEKVRAYFRHPAAAYAAEGI